MSERRAFLGRLAAAGIGLAGVARAAAPQATAQRRGADPMRNVRDFGAKGDGLTDDTAAFNAATAASAPFPPQGAGIGIFVPPGTYRVDGTIWLRKGQALVGAGDASVIDASRARGRTIVLGRNSRDIEDLGGAPVTLGELRFFGGSDRAPLIDVPLAGFSIRNLFITSVEIAIAVSGGDGIVSNVIVDQALNGIVLKGARNILVSNLISYAANYAVTIDRATNDVALSGLILAYSKNASILFAEGATGITSVRVSDATFVSSIEYPTFVGHVHIRAEGCEAQFSNCIFRNWRGFAVTQEAGSDARLLFANCTFDGARSHPSYNVSATASGIRTGVGGGFRLRDCRFLHLPGPVALIGPDLRELILEGGSIEACQGDPIHFAARAGGRISVRGVDGFGRRIEEHGASTLVLPYWGSTTLWRVVAARRNSPGGATIASVAVCENGEFVSCAVDGEQRHGAAPPVSCSFGPAREEKRQLRASGGSGVVHITAHAPAVDWRAETEL